MRTSHHELQTGPEIQHLPQPLMHRFPTQPENLLILTFSQARSKDDTNIFPLDGVDIESVSNKELVRLGETALCSTKSAQAKSYEFLMTWY